MATRVDPATVGYLGDLSKGIYRYRVYFQAGGNDMHIDYFAHDRREAEEIFYAEYPQDDIHLDRLILVSNTNG